MKELTVLMEGHRVATVGQAKTGKLQLEYELDWREHPESYPISLSMPLSSGSHSDSHVNPFLWGLLPDNEYILDRWGKKFQVSARNPFALLQHVGEDCAGAVQFVASGRMKAILKGDKGDVQWLGESDVADRLRLLKTEKSAWRAAGDSGQFSLAGAQPKTALQFVNGKWGVPSGRSPTTHILKPASEEFEGHAENEHFCLTLARALGMPSATSQVLPFGGEKAIVIERYDRLGIDKITRVHQEDMCQALSVPPTSKYENVGGPGAKEILSLIREHSSNAAEDVLTFRNALFFNWVIAGTDAHAKNYGFLLAGKQQVRLAPLYDVASALPYQDLEFKKLKSAMRVHKQYFLYRIGKREWKGFARDMQMDESETLQELKKMMEAIPKAAKEVAAQMRSEGLKHPIIKRLRDELVKRSTACLHELA